MAGYAAPSTGEFLWLLFLFVAACGLIGIGMEHLVLWLWHHVHIRIN